nr:retrovirus-related Pol polyprotein from transposon TNT 1-94 [Tanacetum cinerariifolium]
PGILEAPVAHQTIPQNLAFQTDDLDAYDSDCDDFSSAKAYSEQTYVDDIEAHSDKENQTNKMVNELLTAELKRYEERIIIFEQSLNVDLNQMEKLIDSQMDDLNHDRNAKLAAFQKEIDTLKETLSNNFKEKESLSQMLSVFKIDSKEKESNYIDKEIVLEKQNKKLENIIMFNLDIEPISPRLKNNGDAHEVYIKWTIEYADTLLGFVERARTQYPSEPLLESASMFTKRLQELITPKKIVHLRETTPKSTETSKPEIKVYSKRPKQINQLVRVKKLRLENLKLLTTRNPLICGDPMLKIFHLLLLLSMTGTVRFRNDQVAKIIGYGDYQQGNVIISRVYYVEGLRHNLFLVGQFCNANLEVAFWKNTFFIRNLEGVDLLIGSRDTNLYTNSLDDMLKTSLICLISKASKTKSWLWRRRLSHLNFSTLNKLAKDGLARVIPKLNFQKDHLCSACALGKSNKFSHHPKAKDTNPEKLYLLHMDLCGPMRMQSINRKKYILVIVDDYSQFTWVKFLRSKDEAPDDIIKCIKNMQVHLNATVRPKLQVMTPATSSSGFIPNITPQQPCNPPKRDDWDTLFQPLFDAYFNPLFIVVFTVLVVDAPRAVEIENLPMFTSIGQDAPSLSIQSTQDQEHSLNSTSQGSSSNVRPSHTPFEMIDRWTKDHLIENMIDDPSRSVSTKKQLKTDVIWFYFDAFLTFVEPKNFKQAMTKPS